MHYLKTSEDIEHALGPERREHLSELLDLPASYGGAELHSLEASADDEFPGSFAGIAASLISFCKKTELPVYIRIAEALETLDDPEVGPCCPTVEGVKVANERLEALREPLSEEETVVATELARRSKSLEVPGAYSPEKPDSIPEPMILLEPRLPSD